MISCRKGPYKACILGASLDTGNMGVTALGTSLVQLIKDEQPDAEIAFFIGKRTSEPFQLVINGKPESFRVLNFRMSPKSPPGEHLFILLILAFLARLIPSRSFHDFIIGRNSRLKAIEEADFLGDIRGGDSFSDIYGIRGMILGSIPSIIAILLRKYLFLLPQTYGPYNSFIARKIARYIFDHSKIILSRDAEGRRVVSDLLGAGNGLERIRFCPDVAFRLEPSEMGEINVIPALPQRESKRLIGLNVSGLLYSGGFTRDNMFGLCFEYRDFVRNLTERLLTETNAHLLLIPHTFAGKGHVESDPNACEEIFHYLEPRFTGRVHLLTRECGPSEIKAIIGLCDYFIGSRMHACIAALSLGIPTIGVAYSRKFLGVFDSIGMGHGVVDARKVGMSEAIETILAMYERMDKEKSFALERIREARELLRQTFREILEMNLEARCCG